MSHPRFCEIVKQGVREGTFLLRNGNVQYSILWKNERFPRWVPALGIERTGKIDHVLLGELAKNISSRVKIRRRGGLQKGPRYTVGKPGGTVRQGRTGMPSDPRTMHKPVKDEPKKKQDKDEEE